MQRAADFARERADSVGISVPQDHVEAAFLSRMLVFGFFEARGGRAVDAFRTVSADVKRRLRAALLPEVSPPTDAECKAARSLSWLSPHRWRIEGRASLRDATEADALLAMSVLYLSLHESVMGHVADRVSPRGEEHARASTPVGSDGH